MIRKFVSVLLLTAVVGLLSCTSASPYPELQDGLYAIINTDKGDIVIDLAFKQAPMTVANFVGLAEGSIAFENRSPGRFYDGLTFHRVVDDFVIQGGDPMGNGTGGPGYQFPDEFSPELRFDKPGTVGMANSGANTNGSQFFITHIATPHLNDKHSVFAYVVQGMDVVFAIQEGDLINHVEILRKGSEAKAFVVDQDFFDQIVQSTKENKEKLLQIYLDEQISQISQDLQWESARVTDSGLKIITIIEGQGESPLETSQVKVDYHGTFTNGEVFDSSVLRQEPVSFPLDRVIPGFREAIIAMKPGGKIKVLIPPDQGYGFQDFGPIKAGTFLIFEIELLEIH